MKESVLEYGFDLTAGAFIDAATSESWGDGLPFAPFDAALLEAAVAAVDRDGSDRIGDMPITAGELCAISLLAGCEPGFVPAVDSAVLAVDDKRRELGAAIALDPECSHAVLVNGPARHTLGVNAGLGLMGPGFPANATIGRALQLTLRYCGLGLARGFGYPSQYTLAFGEDEGEAWIPYHVQRGFRRDDSTVSVLTYTKAGRSFDRTSTSLEDCYDRLGLFLRDDASGTNSFGERPISLVVAIAQEWRRQFAAAGHTKDDVRTQIFRRSLDRGRPGRSPRMESEQDISVIGCGGPADASIWFFVGVAGQPCIRPITIAKETEQ